MDLYKIDFKSLEWDSPMPGLRQKVMQKNSKKLRLVEFSKELPPHWCEKGHFGYILEGSLEIEFSDGKRVFGPGDGVFIPAGAKHRHSARTITDTVLAILVEDI